jgi:hypothetical protein
MNICPVTHQRIVYTVQADEAAARFLARTGTAQGLLDQHYNNGGFCAGGHYLPQPWPCDVARLCMAALQLPHTSPVDVGTGAAE